MPRGGARDGSGRKKTNTTAIRRFIGISWLVRMHRKRDEVVRDRVYRVERKTDEEIANKKGLPVREAILGLTDGERRKRLRKLAVRLGYKRLAKTLPKDLIGIAVPSGVRADYGRKALLKSEAERLTELFGFEVTPSLIATCAAEISKLPQTDRDRLREAYEAYEAHEEGALETFSA